MAKITWMVCDLCLQEGKRVQAVAEYQDVTGWWREVCSRHLATVKEAGLEWAMLRGEDE